MYRGAPLTRYSYNMLEHTQLIGAVLIKAPPTCPQNTCINALKLFKMAGQKQIITLHM